MNRYKLIIAYDGTNYAGWQVQKDHKTIAQTLQDTFAHTFNTDVPIIGVSRTDAGVHALGQVATFRTETALPDNTTLAWAWNNMLPTDIHIRSVQRVELDHNPFLNIAEKTYHYHFFTKRPLPFVARYGWHIAQPLDMQKLRDALQVFVGTHDFRSFATGDEREDTVRTVNTISLEHFKRYGTYRIVVRGQKFLHHMVRRMVGAAVDIARKEHLDVDYLKMVLMQKDPRQALYNAPARGLLLKNIRYKREVTDE